MFCFRRVFIAHLVFDGRSSSYTEGVTAFRSQKALYGLFVSGVYDKKGFRREKRLCFKVSHTGKPF